jgi:hypothetical protein
MKTVVPIGVLIWLLGALNSFADSYTLTVPPGTSTIANYLDHGANTLDEVLTNLPDGTQILKWNCGSYTTYTYSNSIPGWSPGGGTLKPGEGAFISNRLSSPLTITFTGNPHTPFYPWPLPCGCFANNLVSSQTPNSPASIAQILGYPPPDGTLVYKWNGSSFDLYTLDCIDGSWFRGGTAVPAPTAGFGESLFVNTGCGTVSCPTTCLSLACASDKTVECGSAWTFDTPAVSDSCCGTNFTLTVLSTVTNISGPCSKVVTRAWQVVDCTNNTATCTQVVTIVDRTPPVLTCASNKTVECGSTWSFDPPTALDACCGANVTIVVIGTVTNVLRPCSSVLTRTWEAADCCNNRIQCTQSVTVQDTTPPVITCATNKTVECGSTWSFDPPTALDSCCGTNVTIVVIGTVTNVLGSCSSIVTRTWEATDCCTNRVQCSQSVTVQDTTPPVLACATNKTVECGSTWSFDPPTAFDACCGTNVTIVVIGTVTNVLGSCSSIVTRTWEASDCCTNRIQCSQSITIRDTTPPVLACATNKTVECGSTWSFDPPTALDACCGTNVTIVLIGTVTNVLGPCSSVVTRTWEASDCCTNRIQCSQSITIRDTTPPVLICASNKTVSAGASWAFDPPTAFDTCCGTNLTLVVVDTVTNGFCPQVIARTWEASDCCTNSVRCSQIVTLLGVPPPNDECSNAIPVLAGSPAACGNTLCATPSLPGSIPPPCGASADAPDVWYKFSPVCSGTVAIDTCGSCSNQPASYDTVLSVYSGPCGSLAQVACNDNAGGACSLQSRVTLGAVAGVTYYIRVAGAVGASGYFRLNISGSSVAPANDDCANAIAIGPGSPAVCGTTLCATPSPLGSIPTPCDSSSNAPDVWYTFTPACDGPVTADTCGLCSGQSSAFDTVLSAYTGTCGALTAVACNDDAGGTCGLQSRITFAGIAGKVYYIRVAGSGGASGEFRLNLDSPGAPPPNDECVNAISVTLGSPAACGTTICATPSAPGIPIPKAGSLHSPDVWYSFTPQCDGPVTIDTCGLCPGQTTKLDTVLSVYSGLCGSLHPVAGNDDAGGECGRQSRVTFQAVAGANYHIRVAGAGASATGPFRLNISQDPATTPSNDLCANATPIRNGTYGFNTCNANTDGPAGPPGCTPLHDVWFKYTLLCSGQVSIDTCNSSFDTILAVYSGSCASLSLITCNDNATAGPCGGSLNSLVTFDAIAGTTYYIRVGGASGAQGWGMLTLKGPYPTLTTLPPGNGPCYQRLFRCVGEGKGTPWSWSIQAPCCAVIAVTNAPAMPDGADEDTVALLVADHINASCPGGGIVATAQPHPLLRGLFVLCVRGCSNSPAPFVFRIGPPGKLPDEQCVIADFEESDDQTWPRKPLCDHNPCSFNPDISELPLANHDLNNNGFDDAIDIMTGTSADLNLNGIPDEVEACVPPDIIAKSNSQVVPLGTAVTFSVTATGTGPLSYQWSLNGQSVAGGTNSSLALPSVSASQLGDYTVNVANACGTNTAGALTLSVEGPEAPIAPLITDMEFLQGNFQLTFASKAGRTYVLEYKNDLSQPSWIELATIMGDGQEKQLADTPPLPATRFYRLRSQ